MKRVAIISPLNARSKTHQNRNLRYARKCLRDSLSRGEAPYASHLLYPQVLDDNDEVERSVGMDAGQAWEEQSELYAVCVDLGVTDGMTRSIERANQLGIPVDMRLIGPVEDAPARKRRSDAGVKRGPRSRPEEDITDEVESDD